MPTRLLHESLCTSESLAQCSPRAQDAFPRLVLVADNFGVFQINARALKGRLWPLRADVRPADITRWIREYQQQGMLQVWEQDGKTYGVLTNWGRFQRIDPRLQRRYPAPPANLLELPGNSGNFPVSVAVAFTDTNTGADTNGEGDFAAFWQAYPRKDGKADAQKAWRKLQPDAALVSQILRAIAHQRRGKPWQDDGGRFIPYPSTWLNGRRWEDEGPAPPPAQKPEPGYTKPALKPEERFQGMTTTEREALKL